MRCIIRPNQNHIVASLYYIAVALLKWCGLHIFGGKFWRPIFAAVNCIKFSYNTVSNKSIYSIKLFYIQFLCSPFETSCIQVCPKAFHTAIPSSAWNAGVIRRETAYRTEMPVREAEKRNVHCVYSGI